MDTRIVYKDKIEKSENIKKVNIDGSVDPFYRYKMDQIIIRFTGANKKSKTFISNLKQIERDLRIPQKYIIAYLGYELSARFGYDESRLMHYINGRYECHELEPIVDKMIHTIVLCKMCNLPELEITNECGKLWGSCDSCGCKYGLSVSEKFYKFINRK